MGFSRQEYWSGLPFPSPGDLLDSGVESESLALEADSLLTKSPQKPFYEISLLVLINLVNFLLRSPIFGKFSAFPESS